MENLVKVENNQIVTDSRSVAEHFGKQHKHVLETIENIKAENSAVTSMFYETYQKRWITRGKGLLLKIDNC